MYCRIDIDTSYAAHYLFATPIDASRLRMNMHAYIWNVIRFCTIHAHKRVRDLRDIEPKLPFLPTG